MLWVCGMLLLLLGKNNNKHASLNGTERQPAEGETVGCGRLWGRVLHPKKAGWRSESLQSPN